jgi:uncharacterized membrane protein
MSHDTIYHVDTQRLEAFSDGVFAIAITLLILRSACPTSAESDRGAVAGLRFWALASASSSWCYVDESPSLFKDIERQDHWLLVINLLLLPHLLRAISDRGLADHLRAGEGGRVAMLLYGGTFTVIALLFNALWLYASRGRRIIDDHVSDARVRSRTLRFLPGPLLYGIGLPLAFVTPWLSLGLYVVLALVYLLPLNE